MNGHFINTISTFDQTSASIDKNIHAPSIINAMFQSCICCIQNSSHTKPMPFILNNDVITSSTTLRTLSLH